MVTVRKLSKIDESYDTVHVKSVGIQPGTTAASAASTALDINVKSIAKEVYLIVSAEYGTDIAFQSRIEKNQMPFGVGSMMPDGGIWFYKGNPILVIEAKYQADRGNAIERWYKNQYIARILNPNISYLTFATGIGVLENKPIWKILHIAHEGQYNVYRPFKNTAFLAVSGFSAVEMRNHIITLLEMTIERLNS